ncbi:MAG: AAA family ATPase [Marinilabilia sp.]
MRYDHLFIMVSFVITGPESTGKSDLAMRLSEHFNGLVVKEYARQYVENLSGDYTCHGKITLKNI